LRYEECLQNWGNATSWTKNEGVEVQVGVEFIEQSIEITDLFNMEQVLFDTSLSISM
jgi:hypothetical protein